MNCEICGGRVYRRLAGVGGGRDWTGPLWHLDMSFLECDDPYHLPKADAPRVLPLPTGTQPIGTSSR